MPKKTMFVDVSTDDLEGLEIDQEVVVTVKGVVKELSAERELDFGPDDSETISPSIMVEVASTDVKPTTNAFSEMADE